MKLPLTKADKILTAIIAALLIIIMAGTVISLFTQKENAGENSHNTDPKPTEQEIESLNKKLDEKIGAYTGLGTIRCITAAQNEEDTGTAVIVTPWLAYPQGDTVFFEELSRKRLIISGIFTAYFSLHTKNELLSTTEEKIKQELQAQINEQLSLGQISQIYFTDYLFLDY